jgi:hypothetical protein
VTAPGSLHWQSVPPDVLGALDLVQPRIHWLSTLRSHHANHIRPNPDKNKVGGIKRLLPLLIRPPGGEIRVSGMQRGRELTLSVQDNGEGLDAEQLNAVFARFYRADKSRSRETGGTGLGLAIVKAVVEAHGGRVEVYSAGKGKGSIFTILVCCFSFVLVN